MLGNEIAQDLAQGYPFMRLARKYRVSPFVLLAWVELNLNHNMVKQCVKTNPHQVYKNARMQLQASWTPDIKHLRNKKET